MGTLGKIGNWFQNTGTKYNLPELGISEKFGVSADQAADNAASIKDLISSGQAHYEYDGSGNQVLVQGPLTSDQPTQPADSAPANVFSPSGGSGGAGSTYTPNFQFIDGVRFDLNDPGQFQAYVSKAEERLNADFEDYSRRANSLRDIDIEEARAKEEEIFYNIQKALSKVAEQEGQYNTDFARSVSDLAEGFRQGSAKRQSFYASIAPRVYQSSQGTSQQYAEGKFNEGQQRMNEQKTQALNAFKDAREDYGRQRQTTEKEFNLFKTRREAQAQDEIANQARTVRDQMDSARSGYFNYAGQMRQSAPNKSQWSNPTFQERNLNYNPSNVNLNDLMQFIKFQPAGGGMTASNAPMASQAIATPEAGGESLTNYMGYQAPKEEQSTINAYKKGYSNY